MRREEVEFMTGIGQELSLVLPDTVTEEVLDSVVLIEEVHDIFGDEKVLIVPALGHTPGHSVLQVELDNSGTVLLTGDLFHLDESRERQIVPRFNFSKAETLQAMRDIEARVDRQDALVVIQHSSRSVAQIPEPPSYFD